MLTIGKKILTVSFFVLATAYAQAQTDSTKTLDSIIVTASSRQLNMKPLTDIKDMFIFSGRKSEVISLQQMDVDISNKTGRQLFAKVPGVFVYDMDGPGNQVNIAARGLDPHRGWEFNIRKDGIITNSDMYGYPASHYSMPIESIDRIELVRGTGSLQYGAQFGGMLNYVSKQGDSTRRFSFESINTAGSFNLLSTYNAIGGKIGKFRYYTYFHKKSRGGYRKNEHTDAEAESIVLTYAPTKNFSLKLDWSRSTYTYRIPGQLNDSMFQADPQQATRSRNYFNPDIHVPSVSLAWQLNDRTSVQWNTSAVLGRRNSVLFDKPTNVADTINTLTHQYNNRQVDIDRFNSYTSELRLLQLYTIANNTSALAAGVQYMNNDLHRTQLGKGTTGTDFDLTLVDPVWGRDMHFKTTNLAFFAENKFQLRHNFSINAGARIEMGKTDLSGKIVYYPDNAVPVSIKHSFPLLGASFSWKATKDIEGYGGFSQAYHPMLFKDLFPGSLYEKVDPNIKDAKGYNAEIGIRGNWKFIRWDISGFLLEYKNRFGTLSITDNAGTFYTYRTNIGNSLTKGLEVFLQADWMWNKKTALSVFTSTAFTDARYKKASVKSGNNNIDITGNKVESAPAIVTRNGATLQINKVSVSVLYSYTGETYADALNTKIPPPSTGAVGLVPAYGILDFNASLKIFYNLEFKVNINNVTDKKYFTKRPSFYPGPGIWPSDGRNASISFIIRL